ncbi:MAG: proton-conducting transporter membrane subunit [Bacteroidota bacterium]
MEYLIYLEIMNSLFLLLLILLGSAILTYIGHRISETLGNILVVLGIFAASLWFFTGIETPVDFSYKIADFDALWGFTPYSWIFAALVFILSPLALLYSTAYMKGKENLGTFYFNFFLSILGMIGITMSQDFISLFIFWEIMTWSSYLVVIYLGKDVEKVGIKYMVFSAIGAYALFMGIVLINREVGSLLIEDAFTNFSQISFSTQILIGILLLIGFSIKSAIMPLHVWAPGAYSNSPMSYTAIFSGALSKMGIYGLGLVFIRLLSSGEFTIINEVFAWAGAITALMATFYAIIQDDAKKLLAYSSIGQLGYIIVGVAIGTEMSIMAAIFLAILHAAFKGNLFMAIGAVEKQTGSTDMTLVTGLIRKMPVTFFSTLVSIIALAAVPPLGGFVGKWMLYESLLASEHFFLVIVVFMASTAAFLYSFKILYTLFLGQEEPEYENIKEAPPAMLIPMVLLSLFLIVTGTFPGILFEPIANGMQYLGFNNVDWNMSLLVNAWGDEVNLQHVSMYIGTVFIIAFIFISLKNRRRTRYVTTKDISTSGEVPLPHENLSYKLNFYKPFERAISPVMKRTMDAIYDEIGKGLNALFQFVRYIYSGNGQSYALYVIIFFVLLLLLKDQIFKI